MTGAGSAHVEVNPGVEAGLTAVRQAPVDSIGRLDVGATTITDAWPQLFAHHGVRAAVVRAIRAIGRDRTKLELFDALQERAIPRCLWTPFARVCRGDRREAWRLVSDVLPAFIHNRTATTDDLLAIAGLFDALEGEATPLTVTVSQEFRESPRRTREDVCRLLARLAQGVEIHVVASTVTERFLATQHRRDLPGVSEWLDRPHADTPTQAAVERALGQLDADSTDVAILEALDEEPAGTLPYTALYGDPVLPSNSAVRRAVGRLEDLALVARFGPDRDRMVELLEPGREFLAVLASDDAPDEPELGCVSATGNSSSQAVLPREHAGRDRTDSGAAAPYHSRFLSPTTHDAAAAASVPGAVTLVNGPDSAADDGPDHTRYVSYGADRAEVVVAVRVSGGFQHTVSTALAFAAPQLLERVLTQQRLDAVDEPPAILRDARCIGALSDEALQAAPDLREAFGAWRERLEEMTTKLQAEEYEDRSRFRQEILRSAHGLAGSLTHLYDVLGVDVVRELRVPSGLGTDDLEDLARSVAFSTAIQSRYESFASYRQLFEERERKRATAFSPTVDAADPRGAFIGSLVIRGTDTHRLRPHLEAALRSPAELHDDAPAFIVPVTVREADRREIAAAARRVCSRKQLSLTRDAVSLFAALAPSPYTVARALEHLGEETHRPEREIRPDEVRYALATVDADRLLPDHAPTLSAIVATLLRADKPLTQADLADRAGVTPRSVRNYRDVLTALGLVRIDETGRYRLALSFPDDERHDTVLPRPVTAQTSLTELASDTLAALLSVEEYAGCGGMVFQALTYPPDPWSLAADPDLAPWLRLAAALVAADPPAHDRERRVVMGPSLEQAPLPSTATPEKDDGPVISSCPR